MDLWFYERQAFAEGFQRIAGIDEAGRGPLAGPVVSAAVILPRNFDHRGIDDSKKLSPLKRHELYGRIYSRAVSIGIGIVDPPEIDRINILHASLLAMTMAAANLNPQPDCIFIDGPFRIDSDLPQKTITRGDSLSVSIAAASIVAKVTRDQLMESYDLYYPHFEFARHKGYPTKAHREAIFRFGCCPIHRKTFKGVKEFFSSGK
jgi:ribonuclease HII